MWTYPIVIMQKKLLDTIDFDDKTEYPKIDPVETRIANLTIFMYIQGKMLAAVCCQPNSKRNPHE
jgi:hypothetical protein